MIEGFNPTQRILTPILDLAKIVAASAAISTLVVVFGAFMGAM